MIDVYHHCVAVTAAHDQWQASRHDDGNAGNEARKRAGRESDKAAYQLAVSKLTDAYGDALGEGVPSEVLDRITAKHLPGAVHISNDEVTASHGGESFNV